MKKTYFAFLAVALMVSTSVQAKVFRNAYIAFEMPDDWSCSLEHTEWSCLSSKMPDSKEAIIILTAKEVGPTDTFPLYETYLNNPIMAAAGTQSKMIYKAKYVQVNNHKWVDGLHLGSEVAGYFTRYLTTIKGRIAVLVTFTAHQKHYSKYSTLFHNAIMSMNVIAANNLASRPELGPLRPGHETIGASINPAMPVDMYGDRNDKEGGSSLSLILGLLLVGGSIAGYIVYKKKKG